MDKPQKIDLNKLKTISIQKRDSKVQINRFGKPIKASATYREFLDSLPQFLKAEDFKMVAHRMAEAIKNKKKIVFMLGAHTLKVGLIPIFIDFMDYYDNLLFAGNGAVSVHDLELAFFGATSEDVQENLQNGTFGCVAETAELYAELLRQAAKFEIGLGQSLGEMIESRKASHRQFSLAYNCLKRNIPLTIHSAIGTDIVHQHPNFDAASCGAASFRDFQVFAGAVMDIADGGVALNIGSAVIMPEVFLKAVAICRNLNPEFGGFTTANFDMLPHYRPIQNVVLRPAALNSQGYNITGHHEIMIPLLLATVKCLG